MLALLSALLLLASAELTTIYDHGSFSSTVGLYDAGLDSAEHSMRVYFNPPRCVSSFELTISEETAASVEIVVGHENGRYIWKAIGSAVVTSDNKVIALEDAPHCVSRFRVNIEKGVYFGVSAETEAAADTRKRAISCTYNAADQWPNTCKSSSAGTKCLNLAVPNYCGCQDDGDCYADVSHPFCDLTGAQGDAPGTCVKCQYAPTATNVPEQGYACRLRTPSKYFADASLTSKTQSPGFTLIQNSQGEQIPPNSFFKEVCISGTNSGACDRCDQASATNAPDYNLAYPDYTAATPTGDASADNAFQDGLRGSYFCKNVYGATSPHPQRPICISNGVFSASGLTSIFNNYVLSMEIGYFGTGTASTAPGAPTPTDPAQKGIDTLRLVSEWEGACGPCILNSAATGGTSIRLHTLCSYTQATTPICDASIANGCRACATNAECGLRTTTCLTDGTGSCTGGANCQANGSCKSCASDADCGVLDGGENKLQAKCDTTTGICGDAFSCTGNIGEGTAKDCSVLNGGSNCNKDGSCKTCATNADCGTTDGGTTTDQQVCKLGICTNCALNSDCSGTTGANCQANGKCVDCTTNATICGAADGGASVVACTPTSSTFCPDANGQTFCNTQLKQCEHPCYSNNYCSLKKTAQTGVTVNNGANCNANGQCADCQTPGSASTVPNSANCGTVDGPPSGLTGSAGTPGQTSCDTTGICVDPFTCTTNPSCSGAPGAAGYSCTDKATGSSCANCQTSGSCLPCVVDYTTTTCGAGLDGGEVTMQPNCQQSSRQCVAACTNTNNAGCAGTQGANCMANGVCFNCRTDADCATGNAWGGDFGAQTVCTSSICVDACTSNTICGANSNCMKDGRCTPCTNDADCVANDGPPPMGTDIKCNSGRCAPPYQCTNTATPADNTGCQTFGAGNNCMADLTCKTCTKDSDCIGDGGFIPNQPKCDVASGTCVACAANSDCLGTGVPLNCDSDGLCRDCRVYPSGSCTTRDGPPATPKINPNCDTLTGVCVDFCVKDSDCLDACTPVCHLERGCCVECNTNSDCPVAQWRGAQKGYTQCSDNFHCSLPDSTSTGHVCDTDSNCGGSTPACDFGQQICVQCLADSHCNRTLTRGTPACHIGSRTCVDCTDDTYCASDLDENGNSKVCGSNNQCESPAGIISVSLFFTLFLVLARLM